jgi:hypothetical protein
MKKEKMQITLTGDIPGLGKPGETVELTVTPSDMAIGKEIADHISGYRNGIYRADEVSPIVLVGEDSGHPFVRRQIGSFIDSDHLEFTKLAAQRCKNALDLDRECDVFQTLLGERENWDASVRTSVSCVQNIGGGLSDPIRHIQVAIKKSSRLVTDIWFNRTIAGVFIQHPAVQERIGPAGFDAINESLMKSSIQKVDFEIPELPLFHVVASKVVGPTGRLEYTMGDVVLLTHTPAVIRNDGGELCETASSYTFRKRGPYGNGYSVKLFRVEGCDGGLLVVATYDSEALTNPTAGGIVTDVLR